MIKKGKKKMAPWKNYFSFRGKIARSKKGWKTIIGKDKFEIFKAKYGLDEQAIFNKEYIKYLKLREGEYRLQKFIWKKNQFRADGRKEFPTWNNFHHFFIDDEGNAFRAMSIE